MYWAIFYENQKNKEGVILFEKGKKYALQLENDNEYFISIKAYSPEHIQCCSFPKSTENKLFKLIEE